MSCYFPMLRVVIKNPEPYSDHTRILSYSREVEWNLYLNNPLAECQEIPCGSCIGCRLDYSRTWADRLMLERQYHSSAYFVTLTYDDLCVPRTSDNKLTLVKKDFQNFMKSVRQDQDKQLKFYASGEYGENTFRPHYHAVIFSLELKLLTPYKKNGQGDMLYISEELMKYWKKGLVVVGEFSWKSAAYVARYVVGKVKGDAKDYAYAGIEPPFALMSKGIGKRYYMDNKDKLLKYDKIYIPTDEGGHEISVPRYFKKMFDEDPILAAAAAEKKVVRQQIAKDRKAMKKSLTNLEDIQINEMEMNIKKNKTKSLKRDIIK